MGLARVALVAALAVVVCGFTAGAGAASRSARDTHALRDGDQNRRAVFGAHFASRPALPGFTIEYGRRVFRSGRVTRNERWRVQYQPEDRIIEVGTR
jgi:hypothetical protein